MGGRTAGRAAAGRLRLDQRAARGRAAPEDFAATALDRPAIDVAIHAPAAWGSAPAPASSSPQPRAPAPPSAAPPSDLGLKIALGALVALIVVITAVIVVGLVTTMGAEEPDAGEQSE
ncbi:MAG: hypothetical protein M5U28_07035 [Sandaracinaceae bacterium]|nr:hypothetical protein [Sandaracinaceae bacterium]